MRFPRQVHYGHFNGKQKDFTYGQTELEMYSWQTTEKSLALAGAVALSVVLPYEKSLGPSYKHV